MLSVAIFFAMPFYFIYILYFFPYKTHQNIRHTYNLARNIWEGIKIALFPWAS